VYPATLEELVAMACVVTGAEMERTEAEGATSGSSMELRAETWGLKGRKRGRRGRKEDMAEISSVTLSEAASCAHAPSRTWGRSTRPSVTTHRAHLLGHIEPSFLYHYERGTQAMTRSIRSILQQAEARSARQH
jgi:hypothetical protein